MGFARDAEASKLVLGKDLERLSIQTDAAHISMGQEENIEQEHRKVWGSTHKLVELSHNRAEEATVTTLKTQVYKIDYFTKKMKSTVQVSITQIIELTYAFSKLR